MTFGFPVVLPNGSARDVVCVVASGVTADNERFEQQLDLFSYTEVYGAARVRFAAGPEHKLSTASIFREGTRLVGSDFENVCKHRSFHGDSAHLALLLQTLELAYPSRSAWRDTGIVWATGAVSERDNRIRLVPVDQSVFDCKLDAFSKPTEPARILICPRENWKDACLKRPAGVVSLSLDELARRGSMTIDGGRKLVVSCEEYDLQRLVQYIFPEIDEARSNRFRRPHLPRIALSLSIVTIAMFGVYQWVRPQLFGVQEVSSQSGAIPEVESIPNQTSSSSVTLQAAVQPDASAPRTGIATTDRTYRSPRRPKSAARADIPTEESGNALPCSDVERAISELAVHRDHDCGITKSVLPSEAQRCNRNADEEIARLRLRMQACKRP